MRTRTLPPLGALLGVVSLLAAAPVLGAAPQCTVSSTVSIGAVKNLTKHAATAEEMVQASAQGKAQAEMEWAMGRPTINVYGLEPGREDFDPQTGLPHRMVAGCYIDSATMERARSHNQRIQQLIRANGLPQNSRLDALHQVSDPIAVYEHAPTCEVLRLNGPALASPDGRFRVRWRQEPSGAKTLEVLDTVAGNGRPMTTPYFYQDPIRLVWGPAGSGWMVLADRDEPDGFGRSVSVMAMDLHSAKWLSSARDIRPTRGAAPRMVASTNASFPVAAAAPQAARQALTKTTAPAPASGIRYAAHMQAPVTRGTVSTSGLTNPAPAAARATQPASGIQVSARPAPSLGRSATQSFTRTANSVATTVGKTAMVPVQNGTRTLKISAKPGGQVPRNN